MFKVSIMTGGSAFRDESEVDKDGNFVLDSTGSEVRRLLKIVRDKIADGETEGVLMDFNGNRVGEWSYE